MDYDIAIIGLGPAGATLARLLNARYRVIAIDKKETGESSAFKKCCGGLLSDDAQKSLAHLRLALPKDVLVDPQIFSVRTIDPALATERFYQRHYLNMDRHAFDMWLVSLIPDRVDILDNAVCLDVTRQADGGFSVRTRTENNERTITARFVIGADGANSVVRRRLSRPIGKTYVAIQEWYSAHQTEPCYVSVFDAAVTDSYGWALTKDDHFIIGAAVPPDRAGERFARFRQHLLDRGFDLGVPVRKEACKVLLTTSLRDQDCGRHGAYFVGEAGGFISCSSLEGLSFAMDTGRLLARTFNRSEKSLDARYRLATLRLRLKLASKILKRPFMYQPVLRRLIMRSGLDSL